MPKLLLITASAPEIRTVRRSPGAPLFAQQRVGVQTSLRGIDRDPSRFPDAPRADQSPTGDTLFH